MRAKSWVKELQRQASPNIVIALAGNKSDLADKRLVETEVCSIQCAHYSCSDSVLVFCKLFSCTKENSCIMFCVTLHDTISRLFHEGIIQFSFQPRITEPLGSFDGFNLRSFETKNH